MYSSHKKDRRSIDITIFRFGSECSFFLNRWGVIAFQADVISPIAEYN